jgi:hypothetical protein
VSSSSFSTGGMRWERGPSSPSAKARMKAPKGFPAVRALAATTLNSSLAQRTGVILSRWRLSLPDRFFPGFFSGSPPLGLPEGAGDWFSMGGWGASGMRLLSSGLSGSSTLLVGGGGPKPRGVVVGRDSPRLVPRAKQTLAWIARARRPFVGRRATPRLGHKGHEGPLAVSQRQSLRTGCRGVTPPSGEIPNERAKRLSLASQAPFSGRSRYYREWLASVAKCKFRQIVLVYHLSVILEILS